MSCPKCNSDEIEHEGKGNLHARAVEFEFFVCRECGTQFVQNPEVEGPKEDRSIPTREELLKKIRWQHDIEYARQDRVQDLLNSKSIPHPQCTKELLNAMRDRQASNEDYETILAEHSALNDRIHALVYSPLFDWNPKPSSLAEVFEREDRAHLLELILAVEITTSSPKPGSFPLDWNQFQRHALVTGLAGWSIARIIEEPQPYRLFAAGLLHDYGRALLYTQSPQTAQEIFNESRKTGQNLTDIENEILDFDHTQIAHALFKRWKMAEGFIQAIQYHHNPLDCRNHMTWACIVHIADILSYNLKLGSSGEVPVPHFETNAVKKLGLTRSQVTSVKGQVSGLVNEIEDALFRGKGSTVQNP